MKKEIIEIILIFVLAAGFLIFYKSRPPSPPLQSNIGASAVAQKWGTKTDERASVTVAVTPTDIKAGSKEWKFGVVMDTHSVELDQDMTKSTVLIDDQGKEYKPLSWEGPVGGHHREGVLIFDAVVPLPKYFELQIRDIGTSAVRLFKWEISK